jgi:diacylglycerol O-acyltransferase-1
MYLTNVKDLQLPIVGYPMNITLRNLAYFLAAPTLCYQCNYPRTHSIRWRYAANLLLRLVLCIGMMSFAFVQYVMPTLASSVDAVRDGNLVEVVERLLKLSIPNTYIWLLIFYWFFHVYLNLLAELTRFGDRLFYKGTVRITFSIQ